MYAKLVIFILIVISAKTEDVDDECKISRKNLPEQKLRDHLFCEYSDYRMRPVKDVKIATNLTVKLLVKYFAYEETTATFSVDTWLALYWKDQHLKWQPKDFDGITQVHVRGEDIWTPDISLYNRADQTDEARIIDDITCALSYSGLVVCVPTARHEALCVPDLTKFPYDSQNCTLRFGSWIHSGEELNFQFASPPSSIDDMQPNGNWELQSLTTKKNAGKYKCCPNNTYPSLDYIFVIKRISANHASTVVIPALVLLLMTLTSLWIPPNQQERLVLCFINLISHFLHLQYVAWTVPMHGSNTPFMVTYARDSLLLSTFTIIFTVIIKNLIQGSPHAPAYISNFVSLLTSCRAGEIILLNDYSLKGASTLKGDDDTATIINSTNNPSENQDWLILSKVLDRIVFILYFLIYAIMFITYIS